MTKTDMHTGLRAWASGLYPLEAGVELLIRTGMADGLLGRVVLPCDPSPDREHWHYVDHDALVAAADGGPWSGGERRTLAIAASLIASRPVDLNDALPGLDRAVVDLVLAAVAHAAGSHEHSSVEVEDGDRAKITRLGNSGEGAGPCPYGSVTSSGHASAPLPAVHPARRARTAPATSGWGVRQPSRVTGWGAGVERGRPRAAPVGARRGCVGPRGSRSRSGVGPCPGRRRGRDWSGSRSAACRARRRPGPARAIPRC